MHIEFQASKEDYDSFLNSYFFKRNIVRRLVILIIISLWIGSFRSGGEGFILTTFFLKALFVLALLVTFSILLPYLVAKINFNKALKADASSKPRTIIIDNDGLIVKTDDGNIFWKWETLKNAEILNGYLFISLFTKKLYLIPLRSFNTDNEALNFLGVIRSHIPKIKGGDNTRRIKNLYYWGLVGFIPNFGVIAGIVLIIKGIQYSIFKLILIGIADISFTFLFWMVIFPKINPNGFKDFSQMELNSLVKNVEFYKLQNGQYPDSLQQLLKDDKFAPINDPIQIDQRRQKIYYYYKKVGSKYVLFSAGVDGIPNTEDDLYPSLLSTDSSKIGLIKP
ncbi:MAG: YcxB family protein [Ferruginibacter sp.]